MAGHDFVSSVLEFPCENERDALICQNMLLVVHIVGKFIDSPLEYEDMISIGTMALVNAANKFDPGQGTKFSTYAYRSIRNTLIQKIERANKSRNHLSLEKTVGVDRHGYELRLCDTIPSGYDIAADVETRLMAEGLMKRIDITLTPMEKTVICMRYIHRMKQKQIGELIGKREHGVSRIEKNALRKLRETFETAPVETGQDEEE